MCDYDNRYGLVSECMWLLSKKGLTQGRHHTYKNFISKFRK